MRNIKQGEITRCQITRSGLTLSFYETQNLNMEYLVEYQGAPIALVYGKDVDLVQGITMPRFSIMSLAYDIVKHLLNQDISGMNNTIRDYMAVRPYEVPI